MARIIVDSYCTSLGVWHFIKTQGKQFLVTYLIFCGILLNFVFLIALYGTRA